MARVGPRRRAPRAVTAALLAAALLPAALAACASTEAFDESGMQAALVSERGPAAAPTGTPWSFLEGSLVWVTNRRVDRQATEESLKVVLMQELRHRGFPPAMPGEARALLGFVLVFERELDSATVSRILAGTPSGAAPTGPRRTYPPGTLVLEIVDATTGELVWRGDVPAGVALDQDAALRNERLRRAASVLLDDFAGVG